MENENNQIDYFGNIKKNFQIRLFILTIVILFMIFKGIDSKNGQIDKSFSILLLSLINGLSIIAIPIGFLYKKKRNDTYKSGDLKSRLEKYLFASRYLRSTIEAGVVFTAVGFALTNNYIFVIETMIFYLSLIYIFPSKKNIQREIELDIDNI
jgi:hypothetical protein